MSCELCFPLLLCWESRSTVHYTPDAWFYMKTILFWKNVAGLEVLIPLYSLPLNRSCRTGFVKKLQITQQITLFLHFHYCQIAPVCTQIIAPLHGKWCISSFMCSFEEIQELLYIFSLSKYPKNYVFCCCCFFLLFYLQYALKLMPPFIKMM